MISSLYGANSLKQQFIGRLVAPLRHVNLILSQPVFVPTPESFMLSGEASNNNVIVFGLIHSGLEHTTYRTRGEHADHFTIDGVQYSQ